MARLQILELPEGASDARAPFVLVVDQCAPQRFVLGMDHSPVRDYWHEVADRIGARGVIVTAETVEVPVLLLPLTEAVELQGNLDDDPEWRARQLEGKLKEFAEAQQRELVDRMDEITDALGLDRLRDWHEIVTALRSYRAAAEQLTADGGHRFDVPGYLDPQRCAQCGMDRQAWLFGRDRRTCNRVRADKESGHDFQPIGVSDSLACLRCGLPRVEWVARRDVPTCDAERAVKGGE